MTSRTIRSAAHRKILTWLRNGPSTVSELAVQYGMRMPHASLACRQLRDAGFITRDETGGLRNAPLFLSQLGVQRLTEDSVAKMMQYAEDLRNHRQPMVLHADENNVLVAYTEPPECSLVFVPDPVSSNQVRSSGNAGGVWVLAPKQNVRWYDLDDGGPSQAPPQRNNTLADFEPEVQRIGLVRGEVFEHQGEGRLVEGQRFSLDAASSPPHRLQRGDVEVGVLSGTNHAYAPQRGLRAHLTSSLNRSLILQSLGREGLEVGDRHAFKQRTLSFTVLKYWLTLKHPRMNPRRIEEVHQGLMEGLRNDPALSTSALEREVLMDFGQVLWTDADALGDYVDMYGMSVKGAHALIEYVLDHTRRPFVIDWPFDVAGDDTFQRVLQHPLCRAFVSRRGSMGVNGLLNPSMHDGDEMGAVVVRMGRSTSFQVDLTAASSAIQVNFNALKHLPNSARELLDHQASFTTTSFTGTMPQGETGLRLGEALHFYPLGDEGRANMWEFSDPLASWIASPPKERPARWLRLHARLPKGWVDLLAVDDLPLEQLPLAMTGASERWQRLALLRIQTTSALNPANVLHWRNELNEPSTHRSVFAACLLCSLDFTRIEHQAAFHEATDVWFERPVLEKEVLEYVILPLDMNIEPQRRLLDKWAALAQEQPRSSLLYAWEKGLHIGRQREPWLPETQRMMMEQLPPRWWAAFAGQWLPVQLASHAGRRWLESFPCSWPAQLARPVGEQGGFPGLDTLHPGFTLTTANLIGANLLGDHEEAQPLKDLYEMVYAHEQHLPVPKLKTHPFAGWLVRPVEGWPRFGSEVLNVGDAEIGALLFARSFAQRLNDGR